MRLPSDRLVQTLIQNNLCTHGDIAACEPFVKRLCQDLPDFDSVWLDALIQNGILTAWQAGNLQSGGIPVIAGRFVLREQIGRHTFSATDRSSRKLVALRRLTANSAEPDVIEHVRDTLNLLSSSRARAPEAVVLPNELIADAGRPSHNSDDPDQWWVVSEFVNGWSTEELLVRGGRFPAEAVAEIGRDLLQVLAWLHQYHLHHGEIVSRNVLLSPSGKVFLVAPFLRRLLTPRFAFSDQLTLRDADGIPPEIVGTGRTADIRGEIYALGCLLWHLLTSRPVVLSADPVTRLMKQKESDIPDVRTWVPDCPEWLAHGIQSMTRRLPELRPTSPAEILAVWKSSSGTRTPHCRGLVHQIPDRRHRSRVSAGALRRRRTARSWAWPVSAICVLSLLTFLVARSGVLPQSLNIGRTAEPPGTEATRLLPKPESASAGDPRALPGADSDGLIRLRSGTVYRADSRKAAGSLRILCEGSPVATVLVSPAEVWTLEAQSVELQGVAVERSPVVIDDSGSAVAAEKADSRAVTSLVSIRSAVLRVTDSILQSPASVDTFVGIEWHRTDDSTGLVAVARTVFGGGGYGISLDHPPKSCQFENTLFASRGGGVLCEFPDPNEAVWKVDCRNVTQRFGFSAFDVVVYPEGPENLVLEILSAETVYDPRIAVVRMLVPDNWATDQMQIFLRAGETGNPAVVPPSIPAAVYVDRSIRQTVILPETSLNDSGFLPAELTFGTPPGATGEPDVSEGGPAPAAEGREWLSSELQDFEGPKLTTQMPGIQARQLPKRRRTEFGTSVPK